MDDHGRIEPSRCIKLPLHAKLAALSFLYLFGCKLKSLQKEPYLV
jgi:hypothetical protein